MDECFFVARWQWMGSERKYMTVLFSSRLQSFTDFPCEKTVRQGYYNRLILNKKFILSLRIHISNLRIHILSLRIHVFNLRINFLIRTD